MAAWDHAITPLALVLHVGGGIAGILAGFAALFAAKGERLHRLFGTVFFVSMLIMAAMASYLAVAIPGQQSNLYGGIFTFYLVATAWATVRRREGTIGRFEVVAFLVPLALFGLFLAFIVSGEKTAGGTPMAAVYILTFIVGLAALTDLKVILHRGISGAQRIARHLWRMCTALVFATGSGFTNGVPRLLPGPMHVTPIFFLPMLVPLLLMIFWLLRVRFTQRFKSEALAI